MNSKRFYITNTADWLIKLYRFIYIYTGNTYFSYILFVMKQLLNAFGGQSSEKDLSLLSIEKLQNVIEYLDTKVFETEYKIHFDSDKMQKDLEHWIEKERQKIHYLEESRHTLLERNLKKQSKIKDMQEYMVWGRAKNEEIILDNSNVLLEIKELQETNEYLRESFKALVGATRDLESKRRQQLKVFKKLYKTTPRYKNQSVQTEDEVKNLVNTRVNRKSLRGQKTFKDRGVQCEILAERARIIGHKAVMTDPTLDEVPLIILEDSVAECESCVTVTSDTNLDSLLESFGVVGYD